MPPIRRPIIPHLSISSDGVSQLQRSRAADIALPHRQSQTSSLHDLPAPRQSDDVRSAYRETTHRDPRHPRAIPPRPLSLSRADPTPITIWEQATRVHISSLTLPPSEENGGLAARILIRENHVDSIISYLRSLDNQAPEGLPSLARHQRFFSTVAASVPPRRRNRRPTSLQRGSAPHVTRATPPPRTTPIADDDSDGPLRALPMQTSGSDNRDDRFPVASLRQLIKNVVTALAPPDLGDLRPPNRYQRLTPSETYMITATHPDFPRLRIHETHILSPYGDYVRDNPGFDRFASDTIRSYNNVLSCFSAYLYPENPLISSLDHCVAQFLRVFRITNVRAYRRAHRIIPSLNCRCRGLSGRYPVTRLVLANWAREYHKLPPPDSGGTGVSLHEDISRLVAASREIAEGRDPVPPPVEIPTGTFIDLLPTPSPRAATSSAGTNSAHSNCLPDLTIGGATGSAVVGASEPNPVLDVLANTSNIDETDTTPCFPASSPIIATTNAGGLLEGSDSAPPRDTSSSTPSKRRGRFAGRPRESRVRHRARSSSSSPAPRRMHATSSSATRSGTSYQPEAPTSSGPPSEGGQSGNSSN